MIPVAVANDPNPDLLPPAQGLAALGRVHLPLTGSADQALQTTIRRTRDRLLHLAREQRDARRPVLVLQLDAPPLNDDESVGSQFERAFGLARFLCSREMAGIKTVAFVPHSLRGHGVLLALACEEIVMAPEAMIGEAGAHDPPDNAMRDTLVAAYREIAETQRTIPVALAVAMIDSSLEVVQVEAEDGTHFLSRSELDDFAANHEIVKEQVLVPGGTLAQFDGREGRQFGFVKYLAANRESLAEALDVPLESLIQDESLAEAWRPVVIDISGEITPKTASRFETLLGVAVQQHGANWISKRLAVLGVISPEISMTTGRQASASDSS